MRKLGWLLGRAAFGLALLSGCVTVSEFEESTLEGTAEPGVEADLHGIYMVNDEQGFIVGSGGLILYTSFGGQVWDQVISGTDETLRAVRFDGRGEQGWIVGDNGTILHSPNRGVTWMPEISGTRENLRAISDPVPDPASRHYLLWAVGDNGTILYSNDSGLTWYPQESTTIRDLRAVVMSGSGSSVSGWAFGDGGTILRMAANDGFWIPQVSPTDRDLYAAYFRSAEDGWVVGDFGTVLRLEGRHSWISVPTIALEKLTGIFFIKNDPRCGWIVGANGRVMQTDSGGDLWLPRDTLSESDLSGVYFFKPDNPVVCHDVGWAIGKGALLHTIDGGIFWRTQVIRRLD